MSTPERLLELVTSKAIDISGVSLLVISFLCTLSTHLKSCFISFSVVDTCSRVAIDKDGWHKRIHIAYSS